ncbi:MAG TPA: hypothetical protein VGQ83_01010 [Polyangia bacterium]|jgi:hypothetical protein
MQALIRADAADAMLGCLDLTCDQMNACTSQAFTQCHGSMSPFIEATCQKQVECSQGSVTLDQCRAQLNDPFSSAQLPPHPSPRNLVRAA